MRKRSEKKRKRRRKRKKGDEGIVIVKAIQMTTKQMMTSLVLDHHRNLETANEERKRKDREATPEVEVEAVEDALVAGVEDGNQLLRYEAQDLPRTPAPVHGIVDIVTDN